jgi:hypothetical protein
LLSNITNRRWLNPCRQYRDVYFQLYFPPIIEFISKNECTAEDAYFNNSTQYNRTICSVKWFNFLLNAQNVYPASSGENSTCGSYCDEFFNQVFPNTDQLTVNKNLLITDLPLPSSSNTNYTYNVLKNYTFYQSGAPLTVIAIDKANESIVYNTYKPLFPQTQLPNLYKVHDIVELLPKINISINFCLYSAPLLDVESTPTTRTRPKSAAIWYYYVIGASFCMLIAIFILFAIILQKIRRKRNEILREMQRTTEHTNPNESREQCELRANNPLINDIWEVPINSLDIDFRNVLGNGAFSVVHSGE